MARSTDFQTIRSEGGLLPPDLLRRVLGPKEKLPGTRPEDYELPQSERLNEVITQSWNRLRRHWVEFRAAAANLPEGEPGTGLTNDRWNLPLLRELGFGLVPASAGPEVGGRTYAINRFFGPVPLHLIGCGLSLDRRAAGVRGAATVNPHGLVQEFLNRSSGHLWAIVTNGLSLRILRDNQALSRQSFLEFDLEAMFAGEVYSDFVLLWLMAHATRFTPRETERLETCWLEQWTKLANEQGTRALGDLRGGVEKALEILGEGFTGHPKNMVLREALRTGQMPPADFHGQLLRVVYRLIFLFVAEDRTIDGQPLLHPRDDSDTARLARECYAAHYSTARLRELASQIKGSRHGDLWRQFQLLACALSGDANFAAAREHLALPALGSFLWDPASTAAINDAELTNYDLLEALRHLAFTHQGKVLRPMDYKNLGAEELGGVYESLLALTPQISADGARFTFAEFAGNERKTSGSYYTPDSLVQCLLDSALDPVVEARLEEAKRLARELVGSREIATRGKVDGNTFVSRPDGLAEGDGPSGTSLPPDADIPEGGTLRNDFPDPPGGGVDTGEYRRGMGPGRDYGIHAISSHSTGKPQRVGNALDSVKAGGIGQSGVGGSAAEPLHGSGQDVERPAWFFEAQKEYLNSSSPTSLSPYSLLAEKALLSLKVCDPAVGSGHFLVGAAHRLARHLARVRALAQGESEPSPLLYQHALRDVIGRCLYGVDINPMAAELCRVSLWLEALEPGKPLSFLDHHIRVGNSLLGATPTLLAQGIPDDAFKPIEGDDKEICRKFKKQNKEERGEGTVRGQGSLFDAAGQPWQRLGDLATGLLGLDDIPDDTIEGVQQKQERYEELVRSSGYLYGRLWADAWCVAFVWKKTKEFPYPITEEVFRRIERNPFSIASWMRDEIRRLADQYQFFHWHLEFPSVFGPEGSGGFDVILGNPPWERVKIQEKEWFAERSPKIANAPNAAARKRLIEALKASDPTLYQQFLDNSRRAEGENHLLRNSGRYPLCGRGDINVYTVFAEDMRGQINDSGRVGCVLPSGIATDDTTKLFFQDIVVKQSLVSFFDFENRDHLFAPLHTKTKFCLFTISSAPSPTAKVCSMATVVEDLRDPRQIFEITPSDLSLINPNTGTCPLFRTGADAELTKKIYRRVPVLINERTGENPWGVGFMTMFHMANDSDLFQSQPDEGLVPLYEAKMMWHFDHRWATYNGDNSRECSDKEKQSPDFFVRPRYWLPKAELDGRLRGRWSRGWLLAFRDVTDTRNERSVVFSLLPLVAVGHKAPLVFLTSTADITLASCFLANATSLVLDFVARQKIGGLSLSYFILNQLPFLPPHAYRADDIRFITPRVLELVYTAWDMKAFADDVWRDADEELRILFRQQFRSNSSNTGCCESNVKISKPESEIPFPPFKWEERRRAQLRAEVDAYYALMHGLTRDELRYILDPADVYGPDFPSETFRVLKAREFKEFGEYRTRYLVLAAWDALVSKNLGVATSICQSSTMS